MAAPDPVPREFFETLADALAGFLPRELRGYASRAGSRNLKVWYGDDTREHYEAQLVSRTHLPAARRRGSGPVLEIGFHAEHSAAPANDDAVARVTARPGWKRALGPHAEAAPFLGARFAKTWRRVSEIWDDGTPPSDDAAIEAAERLAVYIRTFEPVRSAPVTEASRARARRR